MAAWVLAATGIGVGTRYGLRRSSHEAPEPMPPEWMEDWGSLHGHGMLTGDSAAAISIIEFVDLQCSVCRSQAAVLERIGDDFGSKVSVRYIHLPLARHPFSTAAAIAAECAARVGRLESFLQNVFGMQDSIGSLPWSAFLTLHGEAQQAEFDRCLNEPDVADRVAEDLAVAGRHDVRATPTVIVNGWRFAGLVSERELRSVIERLEAGGLPQGALPQTSARQPGVQLRIGRADRGVNPMVVGPVALSTTSTSDPEFDLTNVSNVAMLSDGRLVTYAEVGARLLVFGKDGRGERRIGRSGRGPREIQNSSGIALMRGDSLVLLDRGNAKIVIASAQAGVVREVALGAGSAIGTDRVAGRMPDGALILNSSVRRPFAPDASRAHARFEVVRFGVDAVPRKLLEFEAADYERVETRYRGRVRTELVPVRFSGTAHVVVLDSMIAIASGSAYHIRLIDARGASLGSIEDTTPRRPVGRNVKSAQVAHELNRLRGQSSEPLLDPRESERLIREAPYADSVAAIHSLFVSPEDRVLWVVDAIVPGDKEWTAMAIARDGRIVANVQGLVSKGLPVAFKGFSVALQFEDAEGATRVAVFPLLRRGP